MLETRWFDNGTGYTLLVMDPATSALTWNAVAAKGQELACITSPQVVDGALFVAPWGYEDGHNPANIDLVAQTAYIDNVCKRETLLLAEAALADRYITTAYFGLR